MQRLSKQAVGSRGPKPLIQAPLWRKSLTSDTRMKVVKDSKWGHQSLTSETPLLHCCSVFISV